MNKRGWIVLGGLLAALVVAVAVGTQAVYADTATPPAPPDERSGPPDGARGPRGLGPAELEAGAKALGMSTEDLSTALKAGKTLDDLATAQGVDIQSVHAAIQAAHKAQVLEDINRAVTDGKMTQDKADWLILGLENGYLDGPGFGFGHGMRFGGPQGRPGPAPQGATQSQN